jgi:hypothetical protein
MILLASYLHRRRFKEIVARWLYDELAPTDSEDIKHIVNFNGLFIKRYMRSLAVDLFSKVHGVIPQSSPMHKKGDLKDFVVAHPTMISSRIKQLMELYRQAPERFYRETPVDGRLYFTRENDHELFLGAVRMKRFRRIAEKGARRISDFVYERIRENAEYLAMDRARRSNVPLDALHSTPEQMLEEFTEAEDLIQERLKARQLPILDLRLDINDVAGLKLVGERDTQESVEAYIEANPATRLIEREEHRGRYNATNLTVELTLDKEALLSEPLDETDLIALTQRGFNPLSIAEEMLEFVRMGEDTVRVELILSDFAEFVESEIGRCQHEDRIRAQRQTAIYRGPLAKNAEYLLTYLFAYAISPTTEIDEIPIKLWGRYMTDYIDQVLRHLFRLHDPALVF